MLRRFAFSAFTSQGNINRKVQGVVNKVHRVQSFKEMLDSASKQCFILVSFLLLPHKVFIETVHAYTSIVL